MKNKSEIVNRIFLLYRTSGWKRWFSRIRIWEAPCWEVEKLVPRRGIIVDLGCGEGIFTNLWALSSKSRNIVGIDQDKERIRQADKGIKNVTFRRGNILTAPLLNSNAIILFHVLHHLISRKDQESLIRKSHQTLKKGGKLIIVEVDIKFTIKYLISWLTDHFVAPVLFEGKFYEPCINYRRKVDWLNLIREIGFTARAFAVEKNKPYTNLVIECVK
ncbi:MAG: class I SAM-dependent methyltransferase [Patescibacteria group bacterium]